MQIDEQRRVRLGCAHGGGGQRTDFAAQARQGMQALGGVDHQIGSNQRGLVAAQQRFVTEDAVVGGAQDGLKRHPQRAERRIEAGFEPGAIGRNSVGSEQSQRLALHARQPVKLARSLDRLSQHLGLERLDDVLERAVLDGVGSAVDRRQTGDEHDRQVGVVGADRAQELDARHLGHGDVADHDVDATGRHTLDRFARRQERLDLVAGAAQHALESAQGFRLVIDEQDSPWPPRRRHLLGHQERKASAAPPARHSSSPMWQNRAAFCAGRARPASTGENPQKPFTSRLDCCA